MTDSSIGDGRGRRTASGWSLLALYIVVIALFSPIDPGNAEAEVLPGGMELIFMPYPESEMVCAAVAVQAGSSLETPDTRGVSHFLEHLCFDGSERFTREEMSSWVDENGVFLNAFTRKETTVYFILLGRDQVEQGIELLSQMLLYSVFPPVEIEKERKIILEEMTHSADSPGQAREILVDRYLYRGCDLVHPVEGYPVTIENISRDQIIEYYREHYRPEKMSMFLIGGFDIAAARGYVSDYFDANGVKRKGPGEAESVPSARREREYRTRVRNENADPVQIPRFSGETTVRSVAGMKEGIDLIVPVPGPGEKGFAASLILEELLAHAASPLSIGLAGRSLPDAEISLEIHREFTALRIHVDAGEGDISGLSDLPDIVSSLSAWEPSGEEIDAARISFVSREAFNMEKFHFFIMLRGERLALAGERYIEESLEGIGDIRPPDIRRILTTFFSDPYFNAVMIAPPEAGAGAEDAGARFVSRVLDNGTVIGASRRTGSGVAAMHLLVRGRSCLESDFFPGMSVVLNYFLENSAAGRELSAKLRAIGARLQYGDNPYIPMDDYYLNNSFSFVRLEAPADRLDEAAVLLADHLRSPAITGDDIEAGKAGLGRELAVRAGSASGMLQASMNGILFAGHPYSGSIFPQMQSLARLSTESLAEFRDRSFCGSNIIAVVVSPRPVDAALDLLEKIFFGYPAGTPSRCPSPEGAPAAGTHEVESGKSGLYLAAGWRSTSLEAQEAAALMTASEVLSRRMQLQIREVEGLAYSTGSSFRPYPGAASVIATVGTRRENLQKAVLALEREIAGLHSQPPDDEEVEIARKRLLARLSRRRLSSINEARGVSLGLYLWEGIDLLTLVAEQKPEDVRAAASENLKPEGAVFLRLLPGDEEPEKKSMPPMMGR